MWPDSRYGEGGICIHGHIHDLKGVTYEIIRQYLPDCLNCGVDINDFCPVTLDELIGNNRKWYTMEE